MGDKNATVPDIVKCRLRNNNRNGYDNDTFFVTLELKHSKPQHLIRNQPCYGNAHYGETVSLLRGCGRNRYFARGATVTTHTMAGRNCNALRPRNPTPNPGFCWQLNLGIVSFSHHNLLAVFGCE
jgi:hypothetical protein